MFLFYTYEEPSLPLDQKYESSIYTVISKKWCIPIPNFILHFQIHSKVDAAFFLHATISLLLEKYP